jgi:hypothetical protein
MPTVSANRNQARYFSSGHFFLHLKYLPSHKMIQNTSNKYNSSYLFFWPYTSYSCLYRLPKLLKTQIWVSLRCHLNGRRLTGQCKQTRWHKNLRHRHSTCSRRWCHPGMTTPSWDDYVIGYTYHAMAISVCCPVSSPFECVFGCLGRMTRPTNHFINV